VQLSQALALNLASGLRSDLKGQTLALRQLQWVIGFNPFSQSLMYGEGYDYLSLHAHRQMDMVGALPVGMDCRSGDQPYWSPSNFATQKEIWVVPASRFLWNLAFLNLPAHVTGRVAHPGNSKSVGFHHLATGKTTYARLDAEGTFSANLPAGEYQLRYGNLRRSLTLTSGSQVELPVDPESFLDLEITVLPAGRLRISVLGRGRHHLDFLTYNARPQQPRLELTLEEGYPEFIAAEFTIENPQAPWLALIVPDGQRAWAKEVIAP
jgi:hypothetical protein